MAKPIKGTNGNDLITSTAADEDINGGAGTDTVVYDGNYDQYGITFLGNRNGHGNDDLKISVSDSVAGRDGTDSLKAVEWLKFNDALFDVQNNVAYFADRTLDSSAQDPGQAPGNMYAGTGIPATHFGIVQAESAGIELGLHVHNRSALPTSVVHSDADGYGDGVLHFQVPSGPDTTRINPDRAEWNSIGRSPLG